MANQQEVSLQTAVSDKLLMVPDYQRPYAWDESQLDDLWEDLDVLGPHGRHYTGTLVLLPNGQTPLRTAFGQTLKPTDVVDGQQRLITCLILVDRIRRAFGPLATRGVEDSASTIDHLRETYGLVKVQGVQRPRLQLGDELNSYWTDTILGDHQPSLSRPTTGHERLKGAAGYFDQQLVALFDGASDADANTVLHDLLTRVTDGLKFLVYEVDSAAEVGVIFETLNGRGKPLSELEKIKNYLLYIVRSLSADRAAELSALINDAWSGIFSDLAGLAIDEDRLLRAHWLATQRPDPRTWQGATSLKDLFSRKKYVHHHDRLDISERVDGASLDDPHGLNIEDYVRSLRLCALFVKETWDPGAAFSNFSTHAETARANSAALRRSRNVANFQPLLFACRLAHPNDGKAYASLVRACEAYAARVYTITQRRANAGQSSLYSLAHRLASEHLSVDQAIREVGDLAWSYADDDKVRAALGVTENWYGRRGHKYFLYEYELSLLPVGAHAPDYSDFVGTRYTQTTEHILPQNPDWDRDDWSDYIDRDQHTLLKHSLGNLVLTHDNSSYSNKGFSAKKGAPGQGAPCYATSALAQEREIAEHVSWGRADMERRLEKLRSFALKRWPLIPSTHAGAAARDEMTAADDPVDDDGDDPEDAQQTSDRGTP